MFSFLKKLTVRITFKLLIITYLLLICFYQVNLPTYAYFHDQNKVEVAMTASESDTQSQMDSDLNETDRELNEEEPEEITEEKENDEEDSDDNNQEKGNKLEEEKRTEEKEETRSNDNEIEDNEDDENEAPSEGVTDNDDKE